MSDSTGGPSACLAVVPVDVDDRSAPLGCAALRELHGRSLLAWSVAALAESGQVANVVVASPPALEEALAGALQPSAAPVHVVPVRAGGPGHRVLAALRSPAAGRRPGPGDARLVLVHDALHPLSSAALVREVVHGLDTHPGAVASAPARAVTDTLKWVDENEVVLGTADREGYRMIYSPQVYRREALVAALEGASDELLRAHGAEVLPGLVQAAGGEVTLVPSPGEAFRVATPDDLVLAEALLHVERDGDVRAAVPPTS
jgi:2-C-methyl-D-erythritol 4-phosphate cytidylyltransferase